MLVMEVGFMRFEEVTTNDGETIYVVRDSRSGTPMAKIERDKPRRTFVMSSCPGAVFAHGCLADIAKFMREEIVAHKAKENP